VQEAQGPRERWKSCWQSREWLLERTRRQHNRINSWNLTNDRKATSEKEREEKKKKQDTSVERSRVRFIALSLLCLASSLIPGPVKSYFIRCCYVILYLLTWFEFLLPLRQCSPFKMKQPRLLYRITLPSQTSIPRQVACN
jgi:hypothetical protein